jgi:phage head maturation protease
MADGVDTGAWDGAQAMSDAAQSDDPAAAYAAICAGKRDGDPAVQSTWALPHHSHPGDAPNVDGVHAALSRINQAQGLINRDAAQAHLDSHMTNIRIAEGMMSAGEPEVTLGEHRTLDVEADFTTLSISERRLGLKLLTYNTVVDSKYGPLMFEPGAFGSVDPKSVRLRMDHADPPTGLGQSFTDRPDAPFMDFKVSKTQRGDEQLTLANDGVSRGVSVGFDDINGGPAAKTLGGRRVLVYGPNSAALAEVSTTWQPTFPVPQAGVVYVLSKDEAPEGEKGSGPMAENQEAPAVGAIDTAQFTEIVRKELASRDTAVDSKLDVVLSAFETWREQARADFAIPHSENPRKPKLYDWMEQSLRLMRGQPVSPTLLQTLALDDVITTDNPGLVPDVFTADYDDLINQDRPFLRSTRQVTAPTTGNSMTLPIITQRAVAGTQAGGEKTDLTTTATQVGTGTFPYQSIFGGADIAIQMILRADASFFDLLTGDMGMAYALDADAKALTALLAGYTDSASNSHVPNDGGTLDPENLLVGEAWQTSIEVYKRAPDTIWMNAAAVAAFIDAKSPTTNAPLYSNLAASFTAAGGPGGTLSGLRPIYVPAMDGLTDSGTAVDVIIGPSRGFVWAEDPARRLTVDVPSKAGRDVALVGGLFPAPRFADAFTVYTIGS